MRRHSISVLCGLVTLCASAIAAPLQITTTSLPNGTAGTAYSQTLHASGGKTPYAWSVSAGALPAGLDLSSAGVISGTPTTGGTSKFTVKVTDSANGSDTQNLSITITVPPINITTTSLPNGAVGVAYSQTLSATGGSGGNTWTLTGGSLPAGLSLSSSGTIAGTPSTAGVSAFIVTVTDSGNRTDSQPLTITVNTAPLTVTTTSLPNGTVGTPYSQTLSATGGSGGYSWTVSSGALPAGLSLSASGTIAGTPTSAGAANFTVTVMDSGARTASKALSITIGAPALTITTTSLPNGTAGTAYSQTLSASGGTGGYSWTVSSGALPAGLSLSAGGTISGAPSAPGAANFTVQVSDSAGTTATKPLSISIAATPIVITTQSLPGAEQGTAYSQSLAATGGAGGYQWSVGGGSLPAGLVLDSTGHISGTVSGSSSSFTVQVADSAGQTASKSYTIAVTPAPAISQTTLAAGVIGNPYDSAIAVSGGQPPYTFSVISGQLPPGLALDAASGHISGTPTQAGSFSIGVMARDAAGVQVQATLTITVTSGLTITTPPVLPGASLTVAYQAVLAAAGGAPPYTWSVTAGALPAGLVFHTDGHIDGTPGAAGTFQFTATAVDANGTRASKDFTVTVAGALTITTAPQLSPAVLGAAYTATLAASGGSQPYTWSITAGGLPPGLTLSAGTIAGTPTATGSFTFTATVADSAGVSTSRQFTLITAPGVTFTNPANLPDAVAGTPYNFTLAAAGGQAPYSFRVTDGALPDGLSLNGSSGMISGVPSSAGTFNFTIEVADAANLRASRVHTIVTDLPTAPAFAVAGVPATLNAQQQPVIDLTLGASFPVAITGRLNLVFVPANGMPDDPAVQFSTGGRSVAFTIPANSTHAAFASPLALQSGSVAGTIQLTVDSLTAGSSPLSAPGTPLVAAQVASSTPAIRSITVTHSGDGFSVQIVGLSTTRDLTSATVRFVPSAGASLQTSEVTVPLADASTSWFHSTASAQYGGQFTLTLPFSVTGGTVQLDSVSVVLTNSVGPSQQSSGTY